MNYKLQIYQGFAVSPVIGEDDSILTISGIKVLDPDLNVDPVRCLIFSKLNSLISLNVDKLAPLIFNCNGCKGSGIGAAIMVFDGKIIFSLFYILLCHFISLQNI